MRMNRIILASHGSLSAGMLDTVQMVMGDLPNVCAVATTRDETENIVQKTSRLLDSFPPEDTVYILTDMLNGSVNNDMLSLVAKYPEITVICGMNACLVLSIADAEEPLTAEELEEIGCDDYFFGNGVCLVEWAERIREWIPDGAMTVTIEKDLEKGFDYRKIIIEGMGGI